MPKTKKSSKSERDRDIEIYQNDRTTSPDPRMFEQEDQTIRYDETVEPTDPEKMSTGGEMVRGMGKAVKGFKKVIIR